MKLFTKGLLAIVAATAFAGYSTAQAQVTYTVGGEAASSGGLTGLAAGKTVILVNNEGDSLPLNTNGDFTFPTALASGSSYSVTIAVQPGGQLCSVSNGSGTVNANVANVSVNCVSTYTVGGSVTGLSVSGLVLKLNNATTKIIPSFAANGGSGSYSFSTSLPSGTAYTVSVGIQPAGYSCSVANGSGTISGNVTNANVSCAKTYTVGGSVSGLTASGLILKLNNTGTKIVSTGAGSYVFSTALTSGTSYAVTIQSQPSGLTCSLPGNPAGTIGTANVTDANVSCAPTTYTVGGNVSGLNGSVTLLNNGGNALTVSANGSFIFTTALSNGAAYGVTVGTQPAGQTCSVTNGSGNIAGTNVSNVSVTCTTNTYTVSGSVSGNSGTVTLTNNGVDQQTVSTLNGSFTFSPQNYGSNWSVAATGPASQTCTVSSNGTGTNITANVTNVVVTCTTKTFTVSGTVSGNSGTVTLTNNGVDQQTVSALNGSFTFSPQNYGTSWSVAATGPASQTCLVSNASGSNITANVTNVVVTCQNNTYTVGGTVTGLGTGLSVTLLNNGGNGITVNATGPLSFIFSPAQVSGSAYNVTVGTQPSGQTCTVTNGSGNVGTTDISNVSVTCSSSGVALNANIILGAPTTNSISMKMFTPDQSGTVSVSYGTTSGSYSTTTAPAPLVAGTPLTFNLSGLSNDTQYYYLLNFQPSTGGSSQTAEYQFHTARPIGSSFTFTIQADSHMDDKSDINVYTKTLQNIAADKPDFHIDLGDTFMTEKWYTYSIISSATYLQDPVTSESQTQARYKYELTNFGKVANTVPLFLVNGNHDAELGWLSPFGNLPTWAAVARTTYFNNPTPNAFYTGETASIASMTKSSGYYSWKWGDALFIALDPFWNSTSTTSSDIWNLTLGTTQYQWLQSTLAANAGMKYKFIFLHNLVGGLVTVDTATGIPLPGATGGSMRGGSEAALFGEWGGKNPDGTTGFATKRPGWAKPIHQLLTQYGVTAVFHGHDHLYADQVLDGIKYQEVPQPSSIYQATSNYLTLAKEGGYLTCVNGTTTCQGSSGYLRVTVDPNAGVTSELVRTFVLPSQGTNKSVTASWNVPAPNATTYTVGGTVTGLTGQVTLLNNGVDSLPVSANGSFTFGTPLLNGAAYNVTIGNQPNGQSCTVSLGSGNINLGNVTNVAINCVNVTTYTVGGSVTGNTGSVTLTNTVGGVVVDTKTVNSGGGSFTFAAQNAGTSWSVAITSSPAGQTCLITNASGSNISANVTNVSVSCAATTYTMGYTVTGNLGTRSITLTLNGIESKTQTNTGSGSFTTKLASGATYSVTPISQISSGTGRTCIVTNGNGVVQTSNVTVTVTCATTVASTFTVSGTASGVTGPLTLSVNGGSSVTVPAGGTGFAFPVQFASGAAYSVTAASPTQQCTVTNGSGNISGNVTNVAVSCVNAYSVGGSVSGLSGSVILLNNGGNALTVSASGAFTFTNLMTSGTYAVTVGTQPNGQICTVTNGSGTISGSNINNILVTCLSNPVVSVTVTGLPNPVTSGSVVVTLNGDSNVANQLTFTANNATQTFPVSVPPGNSYNVSVVSNTIVAARNCTVTNGVGVATYTTPTVAVSVVCKAIPGGPKYFVSGTVSGLTASGLVVTLNPIATPASGVTVAENITLAAGSTGYAFSTGVNGNNNPLTPNTYVGLVTVTSNPTGLACTVANNGTVTIGTANPAPVAVSCIPATYTVGGTISGQSGTVTLTNNGANPINVSVGTGLFTFPAQAAGTSWNVAVSASPAGQTCLVFNGSGSNISGNVTSVSVTCAATTYTIGGTVSGLGGIPVTLLNNGGDALIVNANGSFQFATSLASGASYAITVGTQPTGLTCTVSSGSGSVSSSNITSVVVTCSSNTSCSNPANAVPPASDPFWNIYSSPTDPDADTTPAINTEQTDPFGACLGGP